MQIENIKISPAEVKNFPTALKCRRLAFSMEHSEIAELLGGEYTPLQVYSWEYGDDLPSVEEKTTILTTLAYVQNEVLAAYKSYIHDITAGLFPAPTAFILPTTQEDYEAVYGDMAEKIPLVAYCKLLEMLHMRLGLPVVATNVPPELEKIFS